MIWSSMSYLLNLVRRLKDVRTRYAATGEKAVMAAMGDAGECKPVWDGQN